MKKRTAIVFVHGQGEQRPMDSVRDLAISTWASDPEFGSKTTKDHPLGFRYWSIPDEKSDSFELRRLACETDDENRRFDFYEFYWAHLITDTSFQHLYAWFREMVLRPLREVPNGLLRIRQVIIRAMETTIAFCLIGMALCVYNLRDHTDGLVGHPLSELVFSPIEKGSLYIALFIGPLIGALAIAGDWARTSGSRKNRQTFNPSVGEQRIMILLGAVFVPLLGLQVAEATDLLHALQDIISALIGLTAFLWIARLLTTALIVSVVGLVHSFITSIIFSFIFDFGLASDVETVLGPIMFATLAAPILISAATAITFAMASRIMSYSLTTISACLVFIASTAFFESFGFFPQKDGEFVQIAAVSVAWGIAAAFLLPEAARFNKFGLTPGTKTWRAGHSIQVLMWLFLLLSPLALLQDESFRSTELNRFLFGVSAESQFTGIPLIWAIPIVYSLIWSVTQRLVPLRQKVSAAAEPQEVRTTTPLLFLGVHICLWILWVLYFHTAIFGPQGRPFYWLFTAAFLAFPAIGILAMAANRSFLIPVMGDSARYLSPAPENIEARQIIRQTGVDLLETLHMNRGYDRIIIVAHSLGSVVALDILNQFWAGRVDRIHDSGLSEQLGAVQDAAVHLQDDSDKNEAVARQEFRQAQTRYRLALAKFDRGAGENEGPRLWRVSDFVTLGSPLTYAQFLLAASDAEFKRRMARLELPACPPNDAEVQDENPFMENEGVFAYPKGDDKRLGPKHSAVFAAVRWTNLYFNTPGLVTGDLIGGDVSAPFGRGIENNAIAERPEKTAFAHNEYWKWVPTYKRREEPGRVSRKELKDIATPEHIRILREALDLADIDAETSKNK